MRQSSPIFYFIRFLQFQYTKHAAFSLNATQSRQNYKCDQRDSMDSKCVVTKYVVGNTKVASTFDQQQLISYAKTSKECRITFLHTNCSRKHVYRNTCRSKYRSWCFKNSYHLISSLSCNLWIYHL